MGKRAICPISNDEKCQKTKSAVKNLRNVRQAVCVAEKVGKNLDRSEILQRKMQEE